MAYGIETIPMTLNHLQGHSYSTPFRCKFSYSGAAVDKISTDLTRRAVPMW